MEKASVIAAERRRTTPRSGLGNVLSNAPRTIAYTITFLYMLTSVLALVWTVYTSFKADSDIFGHGPWALPQSWHPENYANAWNNANIGQYFGNSLYISIIATVGSVILAAMAAYVLARTTFVGNRPVLYYFIASMMVPGFLYIAPAYRLMVHQLQLSDNPIGLILLYVTGALPFDIFILTGFFKTLPTELEEAAFVDGASIHTVFWRVMLPLAQPGLLTVGIFNFIGNWNEFFWALVLLAKQELFTLPRGLFALYLNSQYQAAWTVMFAGIIIATIPTLVVFAVLQDRVTQGLTVGALKG